MYTMTLYGDGGSLEWRVADMDEVEVELDHSLEYWKDSGEWNWLCIKETETDIIVSLMGFVEDDF